MKEQLTYGIIITIAAFYEASSRFILLFLIRINFYLKYKKDKHNMWSNLDIKTQYLVS
ncbi:MAG: hypothetical protein K0R78_2076 [Pelosinus sp.]|jgi:hypothetical protein|nr:hypothetical protein [Pelosinus sp.]